MKVFSLVKRILLQFLRDKRTMALIIIAPIFIMSLFYIIFREELSQVFRVGIVAAAEPAEFYSELVATLQAMENLDAVALPLDLAGADEKALSAAMAAQNLDAVVSLGNDFAGLLERERRADFDLFLDGTAPGLTALLPKAVEAAALKALLKTNRIIRRLNVGEAQFMHRERFRYFKEDYRFIDLVSPVFVAFFVYFISFLLTSVAFLRERSSGTLERIFVSPLGSLSLIVGYLIAYSVILGGQSLLLLFFSTEILGLRTAVHFLWGFLPVLLTLLLGVTMGIFFSALAKNEFQVIQFIPIVIIPQALLSGLIFDIKLFSAPLQVVSWCMPLTYTNALVKGILLKGQGIDALYPHVLALLGFLALFCGLSFLVVQRQR